MVLKCASIAYLLHVDAASSKDVPAIVGGCGKMSREVAGFRMGFGLQFGLEPTVTFTPKSVAEFAVK